MHPIIKILYINFLVSGPDRSDKITRLYESCLDLPTPKIYNDAEDFYRTYQNGETLAPIQPIKN